MVPDYVCCYSYYPGPRYVSRMRSKGFPFHSGGLGVEGVFAQRCPTVRNRPQPSATVRNRPQPSARLLNGRAFGKFCRSGHFWRFQMFRCFVSRGMRGTSWHSDVFCNASKMVLWSPYQFKLQSLWPQALYRGFHFSQANPEMKSRSKIL